MSKELYHTAFIDSDVITYHAAFAAQRVFYDLFNSDGELEGSFSSHKAYKEYLEENCDFLGLDQDDFKVESRLVVYDEERALRKCDTLIKEIKDAVPALNYVYYLTGEGNFREDIASLDKYKGNRDGIEKPVWYQSVKDYLIENYAAKTVRGIEADDACAVGMVAYNRRGRLAISCSIDKDLLNVPGKHYGWKERRFYEVSELDANLFLYEQIIAGDPTDNYKGCKGYGSKRARKALEGCTTPRQMYEVALSIYRSVYGDVYEYEDWKGNKVRKTCEEILYENARLAYILRNKGEHWEVPENEVPSERTQSKE